LGLIKPVKLVETVLRDAGGVDEPVWFPFQRTFTVALEKASMVKASPLVTWLSLWIAILGFALAVISLLVHILQFKRSGGQIEVSLDRRSLLVGVREPDGEVKSAVRRDGLLITARNLGRLETYVTDFGLALPDTVANMWPEAQRSGATPPKAESGRLHDDTDTFRISMEGLDYELPQRLAPGESGSWWLPLDQMKSVTVDAGVGLPVVRGAVISGSGKRVISKTSVDLAAPERSFDSAGSTLGSVQDARFPKKRAKAPRVDVLILLPVAAPPRPGDGDDVRDL
jgi:hypothetical protein